MSVTLETGGVEWANEEGWLSSVLGPLQYHFGGSTAINGVGNDLDVIIYQGADLGTVVDLLEGSTWELLGEESYNSEGDFVAFRKGNLNIIVCNNTAYYRDWLVAMDVCCYLAVHHGLTTRDVRVAIHKMIVDGEAVE